MAKTAGEGKSEDKRRAESHVTDPSLPSCSGIKKKKKTMKSRGRTKAKDELKKEDDVHCPMCGEKYKDGEDWICCDICNNWFSRGCAGLEEERLCEQSTTSDMQWICQQCKVWN